MDSLDENDLFVVQSSVPCRDVEGDSDDGVKHDSDYDPETKIVQHDLVTLVCADVKSQKSQKVQRRSVGDST